MKTARLAVASIMLVPLFAFAQSIDASYVDDLVQFVNDGVKTLIPLLIGIAILLFVYGLVMFILAADDEEARSKARLKMVWGVIAIFVMVSVWGLVNVLDNFFNLNTNPVKPPVVPTVPRLN